MTAPTDYDLEQLLNKLTRPIFVWRMAQGRAYGNRYWDEDDPQVRSARTRRHNALEDVREILERLGWRYEGADHDVDRATEELLR